MTVLALLAITVFPEAVSGARAADDLLYYVKDGSIVVTNTPDRKDARPVPSLSRDTRAFTALPATPYDPFIARVAQENGVDPSLIKAVALVESGFRPHAVSRKGAAGIMQLMPATARRYGVEDPHDPYESLRAGAEHLRDLLDEFGGDVTLALAAYNAGAGAVRRHGGVPAYAETREYVKRVQARMGGERRRASGRPTSAALAVTLRVGGDGSVILAN